MTNHCQICKRTFWDNDEVFPILFDTRYCQDCAIKACEKMEENSENAPHTICTDAHYEGKNPQDIKLEAAYTGDPGIYDELRIGAFKDGECVADILVGLNETGEVRVLITTDGDHMN